MFGGGEEISSLCMLNCSAERLVLGGHVEVFLQKAKHPNLVYVVFFCCKEGSFQKCVPFLPEMIIMLNNVESMLSKTCFFLQECWVC